MKTLVIVLALCIVSPAVVFAGPNVISYDSLQRDQQRARERAANGPTEKERQDEQLQQMRSDNDQMRAQQQQMQAEMDRQRQQQQQQQQQQYFNKRW